MTAGQIVHKKIRVSTNARFAPRRPLAWAQESPEHRSDLPVTHTALCCVLPASRCTRASRGSPAAGVRLPAVSTSVGGSPSQRVMVGVVRTC